MTSPFAVFPGGEDVANLYAFNHVNDCSRIKSEKPTLIENIANHLRPLLRREMQQGRRTLVPGLSSTCSVNPLATISKSNPKTSGKTKLALALGIFLYRSDPVINTGHPDEWDWIVLCIQDDEFCSRNERARKDRPNIESTHSGYSRRLSPKQVTDPSLLVQVSGTSHIFESRRICKSVHGQDSIREHQAGGSRIVNSEKVCGEG